MRAGRVNTGLHDELTCTMAARQLDHLFVDRYQYFVVSGGAVQCPPEGLRIQVEPMNPNSLMHRSSSAIEFLRRNAGRLRQLTDAHKVIRYTACTRGWIRSLQCRVQFTLVVASPMWCAIAEARAKRCDVRTALALQLQLRAIQTFRI